MRCQRGRACCTSIEGVQWPVQVPSAKAGAQIESLLRSPLLVFEPLLSLRVLPPPVRPPLRDALAAAAWPWVKCRCSDCVWVPLRRRCLGTAVQCLRATRGRNGCPFAPLYCTGTAGPASFAAPASVNGVTVASSEAATKPTLKRKALDRCQHDFDIFLRYQIFLQIRTEVSLRVQPWSIMTRPGRWRASKLGSMASTSS